MCANRTRQYCALEFDMGKSHAYRVLDAARVVAVLPDSPMGECPAESGVLVRQPCLPSVSSCQWRSTGVNGGQPTHRRTRAMAVTAARITGVKDTIHGNERVRTRRLTFSGNYATGGEAVTPAMFGLRRFTRDPSLSGGMAMASGVATSNGVSWDHANSKIVFYETGSASGAPLSEKNNAEAHISGAFVDATAYGV